MNNTSQKSNFELRTAAKKSNTVTFVTPDDLEEFRIKLLEDIKQLLAEKYQKPMRRWIKSHEAMRILTVAPITLQRLRNDGTLPFTRMGRTIYYDFNDIEALLVRNKKNLRLSTSQPKQ